MTSLTVQGNVCFQKETIGGMKAGTFDIYHSHAADHYITQRSKSVTMKKEGKVFHSSPGLKSTAVKSIISVNVNSALCKLQYEYTICDDILMWKLAI
ncbi:unnamed protein product, partial [Coregonus sp. 'balchen']